MKKNIKMISHSNDDTYAKLNEKYLKVSQKKFVVQWIFFVFYMLKQSQFECLNSIEISVLKKCENELVNISARQIQIKTIFACNNLFD